MQIKVGDRITFKAATRWSHRKATRVVNGFYCGRPTVRYAGCGGFIVHPFEILEHTPAKENQNG